jgi:hypothetical protein
MFLFEKGTKKQTTSLNNEADNSINRRLIIVDSGKNFLMSSQIRYRCRQIQARQI